MAQALTDDFANRIGSAVALRSICHCVFAGGPSRHRVMERLSVRHLPWSALHQYPSDGHYLPVGHPARNDQLIKELSLGRVPPPYVKRHSIPGDLGPAEGAALFSQLFAQTPPFDIALLGVGSDGQTASFSPTTPHWQMSVPPGRCVMPRNHCRSGSRSASVAF